MPEFDYAAMVAPGAQGDELRLRQKKDTFRDTVDLRVNEKLTINTTAPVTNAEDANNLLAEKGFAPGDWLVKRVWMNREGGVSVEAIPMPVAEKQDREDIEKLIDGIKAWRPAKNIVERNGGNAYLHVNSDWQIGKRVGSAGTAQSIARVQGAAEKSIARFQLLNKAGLGLGTIVLPGLGDVVEGNTSQHGKLQGQSASDLGQTEQFRVARRLLLGQIKVMAPYVQKIIIPVVNGNHDETGRMVAIDPADGWNSEMTSSVQMATDENPALAGKVEYQYQESMKQSLTTNVCGVMLGIFHGDQMRDPQKFIAGHAKGESALGGAEVFLWGHYHNFKAMDISHRFGMQAPTTDPGSAWYEERTGEKSHPGVLTFAMGPTIEPREWISVIPV